MSSPVAPAFQFGVETPLPLEPSRNYVQLLGWAYLPGSNLSPAVRMVVGDQVLQPVERISRPDVAANYPAEPLALASGFKFLSYFPFGFYAGRLEASNDGSTWQILRHLTLPVSSHPVLGAIERPSADAITHQPVRVEGWCFHPEFETESVVLQFGNVEVSCEIGLARPDTAERFAAHARARNSGFITTENLPRGRGTVKIRLETKCGRIYFVESNLSVDITTGWIPKPPPPSPIRDLSSAVAPIAPSPAGAGIGESQKIAHGKRNILFVLYGDFGSNSALHVAALANQLIKMGYDCVVAVPHHKETIGALPQARFMSLEFSEASNLHAYFKDGLGPAVIHAWTPREIVRKFCTVVSSGYDASVVVHLEDNEREIAQSRLDRPYRELAALAMEELDEIIPEVITHPRRGNLFLESAIGTTVIVESLREHVPPHKSCHVIWPAADAQHFKFHPRNETLRQSLGIPPATVVLFYHGNVHTSNHREVMELYRAVEMLNQQDLPTLLIRTGRDFPEFLPDGDAWIRPHLIHLGHIGRARNLPPLMAMADYFVQPGLPGDFNDYRFPSKLPEFFAIGRPVILPRSNLGNILHHGEDAWILPRADAAAICQSITSLHHDPKLVDKLTEGARRLSEKRFSWAQSARDLAEYYRSVADIEAPVSSAG